MVKLDKSVFGNETMVIPFKHMASRLHTNCVYEIAVSCIYFYSYIPRHFYVTSLRAFERNKESNKSQDIWTDGKWVCVCVTITFKADVC